VKDLEDDPSKIDYDVAVEVYQNFIMKEREAIEEQKKKKLRDVELWNRALREEEKIAVEKYAKEQGDKEIQQIEESIRAKQEKEKKEKAALSEARGAFTKDFAARMVVRNEKWEQKKAEYMKEKMEELKQKILEHAQSELRKVENKRLIAKRQLELKERDDARRIKDMEERVAGGGRAESPTEGDDWGRGGGRPQFQDRPPRDGDSARKGDEGGGFIQRSAINRS